MGKLKNLDIVKKNKKKNKFNAKTTKTYVMENDIEVIIGINLKPSAENDNSKGSCSKDIEIITISDSEDEEPKVNYSPIVFDLDLENSSSDELNLSENKNAPESTKLLLSNTESTSHVGHVNESSSALDVENTVLLETENDKKNVSLTESVMDEIFVQEIATTSSNKNHEFLNTTPSKNLIDETKHFYCIENKVLVILEANTKFQFIGKLKIKVLYGSVDIYGSKFNKSNSSTHIEVYSPKCFSFVVIQTTDNETENDLDFVWEILTQEGIQVKLHNSLTSYIKKCKPGWAILLLENFENSITEFLNAYCPLKLFPKLEDTTNYSWNDPKKAEIVLQANLKLNNLEKGLSMDNNWKTKMTQKILEQFSIKSRCMIIGGKSVGKSTTMRHLVNSLLPTNVILLDLDPGQAECTPAGSLSLTIVKDPFLGPNFTHLQTPYYQLHLGEINVSKCLPQYLEAVKKLVNCIDNDKNLAGLPVIVNTMGFCKNLGLDITVYIIKLIQPTDVIQIISTKHKNNFDLLLNKEFVSTKIINWVNFGITNIKCNEICNYELHIINSRAEGSNITNNSWKIEPYQQRELVMLAYLSQLTKDVKELSINFTVPSINHVIPYTISLDKLYISLNRASVPSSHILAVINGNIVGLCGIDVKGIESNVEAGSSGVNVLIRPPLATCYGYGIVRGIDIEKNSIYIIAPLPLCTLKHINCLIGCTSMPETLLQLNEFNKPYAGGNNDLPTSKDSRRGYFHMKKDEVKT